MSPRSRLSLFAAALPAALALAQPAAAQLRIRAENPLAAARPDETLSVAWTALSRRLPAARAGNVRVRDAATGAEVPSQVLDADGDGAADSLLVLASFWPGESRAFTVEAAAPAAYASRAHVLYVPARDDVAWESDRGTYRTYGQGLWRLENTHSSGVDVWTKRTRALILDKWYAPSAPSYHADHGEGADFYKVGGTLGSGGTGVWMNGRLYRSENFKRHRIVADGPVRAVFELEYDPLDAGGTQVTETRRVSIDAGQALFRTESTFRFSGDAPAFATGTVKRPGLVGSTRADSAWAWSATWGPVDQAVGGHGELGTAIVLPRAQLRETREAEDHYLTIAAMRSGEPVVFYSGAGWTAAGEITTPQAWWAYLDAFVQRLAHPIRVSVD